MSTGTMPILTCDQEDGCDEWAIDYYTVGASVPKLPEGWTAIDDYYVLCPRCSAAAEQASWAVGTQLGDHKQFYNDAFPDWQIYEQTAGFFVWQEFRFHSQHPTFIEAVAAVKAAS